MSTTPPLPGPDHRPPARRGRTRLRRRRVRLAARARSARPPRLRRRVRRLCPGLVRLLHAAAEHGRARGLLRPGQRPDRTVHHRHPGRLRDRRRRRRGARRPDRPGQGPDDHGDHLRGLHRGLRLRAQLRDAAGLPRPPGPRLRRRVGGRRDPGRRVRERQAPRPHARRGPELLGRRLGAWPSIVYTLVFSVPRRRPRLARDVLDRRAARAAGGLGAAQGAGRPGGGRRAPRRAPRRVRSRRSSSPARPTARPAADHALRGAALHRRPGRLLHAGHLGAHVPEDGARAVGRRHRRLSRRS